MSTLYKRATPAQHRILRAVEGAVKNVAHAHPEHKLTPGIAKSIAKRAAGTLTAQWPEVLAARFVPSVSGALSPLGHARRPASHVCMTTGRGPSRLGGRPPLVLLWKELSIKAGAAKRAGQTERAEAFIEVLKRVASLQRKVVTQLATY
jgi:hypothetical protein